jgi:hypothetical protein
MAVSGARGRSPPGWEQQEILDPQRVIPVRCEFPAIVNGINDVIFPDHVHLVTKIGEPGQVRGRRAIPSA